MIIADIHTHILPQIDDGAENEQISENMLLMLKNQGITDVCFTPHYDPRKISLEKFSEKRQKSYLKIKDVCLKLEIKPHLAAEVKLYTDLFGNDSLSELCIDGGEYMLVELPFDGCDGDILIERLYKLQSDYSVVPIIVHPERYKYLFNRKFLEKALDAGCYFQADTDALTNLFLRKKIIKFIDCGLIQFIASDCHNTDSRCPDFDITQKYLGAQRYCELCENAAELFD